MAALSWVTPGNIFEREMPAGLYIARLDLDAPHLIGVQRKIEAQRAALAAEGLPTQLLYLKNGAVACGNELATASVTGNWRRRTNHYVGFNKAISGCAGRYGFVYMRFQGAPPGFASAMRQLKLVAPDLPVLLEIPTWPYRPERRGLRAHIRGFVSDWDLGTLSEYVDRIVTFSRETEIFGVPTIRIQNGVDVRLMPVFDPHRNGPIRMVGVANLAFWHGYDRVISGLAIYRDNGGQGVLLDIVGVGDALQDLQKRAVALGLGPELICFHGPKRGEELDAVLAQSHVGLGSLGVHRISRDTTDLKGREYCARAIPFISASNDPDFPEDFRYVYRVPADESSVDIKAVVDWYRSMPPNAQSCMRSHAETNLTWSSKLAPVVEWLKTRTDGAQ